MGGAHLQDWFERQCDGNWEHCHTIKIYTLDNPGWTLIIDIDESTDEDISDYTYESFIDEQSDWYSISVKNKEFRASGDVQKLGLLIEKFKELVIDKKI